MSEIWSFTFLFFSFLSLVYRTFKKLLKHCHVQEIFFGYSHVQHQFFQLVNSLGKQNVEKFVYSQASLVAQMVKNRPAMQETWVQPLGWEDPPEEEMATHSHILAGIIIPWKRSLVGYIQSLGSWRVRHNWATNTFTFTSVWSIESGMVLELVIYIWLNYLTLLNLRILNIR